MESDQCAMQMSSYPLNGGMNFMVANIMNEATSQQNATGPDLSSDPNNLNGCIESSTPQEDRYAVEVPKFDYL